MNVLAVANKYTDDSIKGTSGVLAGKNCQILSSTPIEGGTRVTYVWYDDGEVARQTTVDVMNGKDGTVLAVDQILKKGTKIAVITVDGTPVTLYAPAGGGGGASALDDLDDVELNDLKDGQILKYDIETETWVNADNEGGSSVLSDDLTTAISVGGIASGVTYEAGTSLETLFRDLLEPTLYPSFTAPSASLSATGAKLLEKGASLATTFTITFSRGNISPAYGTNGYRSGEATGYGLNGSATQQTNTFAETVTESQKTYQGTVAYSAGQQPKDSKGKDYDSPLSAGSVNTNVINYEFVNALYANTSDITSVAKLTLISKSAKVKEFNFPAQTVTNPEEFHVDASWSITAVEVLNTLSNQWENCAGEFTVTDTTHNDAGGNVVNYKKYLCNLGVATGSRKIRIKWS